MSIKTRISQIERKLLGTDVIPDDRCVYVRVEQEADMNSTAVDAIRYATEQRGELLYAYVSTDPKAPQPMWPHRMDSLTDADMDNIIAALKRGIAEDVRNGRAV